MSRLNRRLGRFGLGLAFGLIAATSASAQQASITLTNSDAKYCYTHENTWTLDKQVTGNTVANGQGTVTWTVTATKDSSAAPTFTVHGGLTITNTGSAPATIGNIVINLQKPNSPKKGSNAPYVSIAADVADATNGDSATAANIVAAASQENATTNALWGTSNYFVSNPQGMFVETAGSGSLEFTDASNNTLFSLVPQPVLAPGQSITLLYSASFNTAVLPPAGTPMRVEALVTFGNAGARGGSGATANNIDINGDGLPENNVRTVASRVVLAALPAAPEECNDGVTLSDVYEADVTTTGTVTTSNPVGFMDPLADPVVVSDTTSFNVSVDVDGGTDGGTVCNAVHLDGTSDGGSLNVIVGYEPDDGDPLTPLVPIYATYLCCTAADLDASACATVGAPPDNIPDNGEYCSFSQGGFGGNGAPFDRLDTNFATMFPSGVEVGIPGAGGFSMKFTSAAAVQAYLPAGGGANKLNADATNPTSTASGQFGGQVLALKLNIALSDAAVNPTGFGDLYYCDATSSLNGQTVRQILAAAETAIGGGALPAGYNYSTLAGLCANLDLSFDGKDEAAGFPACGVASAWATQYLRKSPCP